MAIGREPLDRRFAGTQHSLVVLVGQRRTRLLDDLICELTIDRSAELVHADVLLSASPWS